MATSIKLSFDEIRSAIAINTEGSGAPFYDEHLELLDPDDFIDSCASLVSTYSVIDDTTGDCTVYLKLAHFTVREFLISEALRNSSLSDFSLHPKTAHTQLANSCLAYFHRSVHLGDEVSLAMIPLANYAGHFWFKHRELAGELWASEPVRTYLFDMFDPDGNCFGKWLEVANVDRPWLSEGAEGPAACTPLYCAAYCGLVEITKALIDRGAQVDEPCGVYGSPLQAAALRGHSEIVDLLLRAGANVNATRGVYKTVLTAAAANGHVEIIRTLLAAGAGVDGSSSHSWERNRRYTQPLFAAVSNGHLEAVEVLLEHGARDSWEMKGYPATALHAAAASGRLDIVKAMMKHEHIKNANSQKRAGGRLGSSGIASSQYSAAQLGHINILRELLAYGISKEETLRYAARAGDEDLVIEMLGQGVSVDDEGRTFDHPRALLSAAEGGHVSIVRELLSRGADPSEALKAAVDGENIEIMQMLVNAGANVNPSGWGPLGMAIHRKRKDLIEFLVHHGADMHKHLRRALVKRDTKAVNLFLELGADIHRRDEDDETSMLGAAAWGGSVLLVQYLLDNGLENQLNPGPGETTPLMYAVLTERWDVVQLLLDSGADVNALPPLSEEPPPSGGWVVERGLLWPPQPAHETALSYAIKQKNQELARELMRRGASTTPKTPATTGTPLLHAVWEQLIDIVRELLERGADPRRAGTILRRGKPTLPILLACEKSNADILKLLLDAGARVDDQDDDGFSALHIAAAHKNTAVLETLVREHGADLDVRMRNGSRPIHSAASKGTAENVKMLLDAGADIDHQNDAGRTPLHWAAEAGNWDTVEVLLERGADANIASGEDEPNMALELAHLAREKPTWERKKAGDRWNDEKVKELLQRLGEATSQRV